MHGFLVLFFSYIKDLSSLWLVLFLRISLTESVVLVPSIIQNMISTVRPGGVGALFCALSLNSDLDLMSHSIFIFSIIVWCSIVKFMF